MGTYTYDDMRSVLSRLGFARVRARRHETWERVLQNGSILQVRLSHKGKRDIPKGTFYEMLRQAGIDERAFREKLRQ